MADEQTTEGRRFETLEAGVFKFEEIGDSIEGTYMGSGRQTVSGDLTTRHDFETKTGPMFFWGSTVLDGRLRLAAMGDYVRVTYIGNTEQTYKGGNPAKLYSVERAAN